MNDSVSANAMPATATALSAREGERIEPRWPAMMAFLTCGLRPATTARRTHHVSLKWAYVVHLTAALAGLLAILTVAGFANVDGPWTLAALRRAVTNASGQVVAQAARLPKEAAAIIAITVAAIELAFPLLALLLTPWGARDEPLKSSYRNALQWTWLHTAHIVLLIVMAGTVIGTVERLRMANYVKLRKSFPPVPRRPAVAPAQRSTSPEWNKYSREFDAYREEVLRVRREWDRLRPWYIQHPEIVQANASFFAIAWAVWALLRGVGAGRPALRVERPPGCESCGYNLTGTALDSRCPECGEPVAASLGTEARRGTAWQRRHEEGRWSAWWFCASQAIRQPATLGRQCRMVTAPTDHRWFIAITLPIIFLLGAAVIACEAYAENWRGWFGRGVNHLAVAIPAAGYLAVAAVVAATTIAAGAVGLYVSLQAKRNVLAGAMQIASYLSGLILLWSTFAAATGVTMLEVEKARMLQPLAYALGLDGQTTCFLVWLLPNALWGIWYFVLLYRGTMATRYANR